MKWGKVIACLLIVVLALGFWWFPATRAQAAYGVDITPAWLQGGNENGGAYGYMIGWTSVSVTPDTGEHMHLGNTTSTELYIDGIDIGPARGVGYAEGGNWVTGKNWLTGLELDGNGCTLPAVLAFQDDGKYHTVSWDAGVTNFYNTPISFPAGSFQTKISAAVQGIPAQYTWVSAAAFGVLPPLSVSVAGPSVCSPGVPYTCTATADGGVPPYQYLWNIVWGTVIGGQMNYTTVYTSSLQSSGTFTYTFTFVGDFFLKVACTDSTGAEADSTLELNSDVNRPALKGQLMRDSASTQLSFSVFLAGSDVTGSPVPYDSCLKTSSYDVIAPDVALISSDRYVLLVSSDIAPNPLVVQIAYTDPLSKRTWNYTFSFDTSGLTGQGSWTKSDGTSGNATVAPGWAQSVINWLRSLFKEIFDWLFVPNNDQLHALFPGGAVVGTTFSPFASFSSGNTKWKWQMSWRGTAVTVMDFDLDTIPAAQWALCRTIVDVVVAGAEIMLLISLL